ncbi:unnamed protein product [Tetraodon nigroviridis]|uniref:(spotted green pufferfish) hypothetical protein n=1 Tax=Tetraodon nigroviridis TaxID=99883 RepID=Q4SHA8_TETNG|nr:unnamed protein product [Tetraodon nigroviridis]
MLKLKGQNSSPAVGATAASLQDAGSPLSRSTQTPRTRRFRRSSWGVTSREAHLITCAPVLLPPETLLPPASCVLPPASCLLRPLCGLPAELPAAAFTDRGKRR